MDLINKSAVPIFGAHRTSTSHKLPGTSYKRQAKSHRHKLKATSPKRYKHRAKPQAPSTG